MSVKEDELQKLWDLPTVDEPVIGNSTTEETEEETDQPIICNGISGRPKCSNEAVLKVIWQPCICGKMDTTSYYCIDCFDRFPTATFGEKTVREGRHIKCNFPIYSLGFYSIK